MQESPDLKHDWFEDIKSLSIKHEYIPLYIRRLNIFPKIGRSETGRWFLTLGTTLAILHSVGKISDSIQEEKVKCSGLQIAL